MAPAGRLYCIADLSDDLVDVTIFVGVKVNDRVMRLNESSDFGGLVHGKNLCDARLCMKLKKPIYLPSTLVIFSISS